MRFRLTLRDYRCFRREEPVVIEVHNGFTAYVGPNNAGKSTILKSFYELRPLFQFAQSLLGVWGPNFANRQSVNLLTPITDPSEIINNRRDPALTVELEVLEVAQTDASIAPLNKIVLINIPDAPNTWRIEAFASNIDGHLGGQNSKPLSGPDGNGNVRMDGGPTIDFSPIQNAAKILTNTLYVGAFRNAINEGAATYYDLRVGTSFIDIWHHWKTGGSKEQNRAMVRVTREIATLLGARSLEISASPELKTLQLRLDDEPYKLSELGSGIAELIVVLANAVIARPAIIAIDEPEAHLHPKLQAEFLTTLGSYASSSVFFTTHVLGLARSIADRPFTVQRGELGSVVRELNKTSNYAEFLGSLGLSALMDVGFDTILLVEGVTEVRAYQQFLRLLQLDHRVVVIPLGGSSLINGNVGHELGEITRLCPRVFAIIDSERSSKASDLAKDRREFLKICAELKIVGMATQRTAIENYFTDRAVKVSRGSQFSSLGQFDKPSSIPWGKATNWLIAREMSSDELMGTDLGQFLNTIKN